MRRSIFLDLLQSKQKYQLVNEDDDSLILDPKALGEPYEDVVPCLNPDTSESDKIDKDIMGTRYLPDHKRLARLRSDSCTTDFLALNAPDYYGFMPNQDVIDKLIKLMSNIKEPNTVLWEGFDVIYHENGDFKYARVANKNKVEESPEEGEEKKGEGEEPAAEAKEQKGEKVPAPVEEVKKEEEAKEVEEPKKEDEPSKVEEEGQPPEDGDENQM